MTPEEWQRVRPILESALELDPSSRVSFLNGACADASQRREVESLIAVHEQAGTNALRPGSPVELKLDEEAQFRLPPGKRIGAYEILEEIAVGGMGAVYRAIRADGQYRQQVALKIVRSELGAEATATRFRNERQILASLDHPNIAKILDGSTTTDGLPYFVMEFIDGLPITDYCDQHKLNIDERLKIFRTVCSAVHYAHQHLVIHRDIKHGNILVTSDGVTKLLDFGIAKILDPTLLEVNAAVTMAGLWVMTPEYASPEQLRGEAITTATDVYSLGLVLYELLTGHRAHRFPSHLPHEIARAVLDTDPEKPSTAIRRKGETAEHDKEKGLTPEIISSLRADSPEKLGKRLAGDLDNIVLKAIRKEARERYSSADQLSEDIRRHLENLPVLARKSTVGYRCRKYVLRHKVGVATAALVFVSLVTGIALTIREARIARANELRAERRFNDVRKLSNSLIFEFHDSIQNLPGATPARKLLLDRALQYLDGLAKESAGDLSLQRELATAYQRIGELQGDPRDANLGETEAAVTSLQKGLAISDSVAKANPTNFDDQLRLAYSHRILSNMLGNTGRPEAREHVEQEIAISERVLKLDPSNTQAQLERAGGYAELAYFQDEFGDAKSSVESLRNALETNENFWKANPGDRKVQEKVAVLRVRIGNALPKLGSRNEALQMNRSGLELFESLATTQADASSKRKLAVTLVFRGDIQMMNSSFQDALGSYQRSLAILQAMKEADPQNVLYRLDAAGATAGVGRALARAGQRTRALAMLDRAIGIYEAHFARDHSYKDLPYWLGQDHIWKGDVLTRDGTVHAALDSYQKAVRYLEQVPGLVSANTRCDLAAGHTKLAAAFAAIAKPQEASAAYQEALKIAEPLASTNPPNVLALYVEADTYFGMGELSRAAARDSVNSSAKQSRCWTEARDWYRKSMDAWHQIPNPTRITPSGFAVGDPETATKNLRECDSVLRGAKHPGK